MILASLQHSPAAFRERLKIETDAGSVRLGSVLDDWQRKDFEALDESWLNVAGVRRSDKPGRAWLERPRGSSKTGDISVQVCWALFAARRAIRGVCAAGDKDQAKLLRNAIQSLCRNNPWLGELLTITNDKVTNVHTGSELEIIASDSATSYGLLVDFIICDEVCHWRTRDLWDSLLSSAAKRKHCLLMVITNAGFQSDWQWPLREAIREDESWYFSRLGGPHASWISASVLEGQAKLLPNLSFRRLWLNEWVSGSGGDALDPGDIDSAFTLGGPSEAERGWTYVAGLDLGLTRDASALVVLGKHIGYFEEKEIPRKLNERQRRWIDAGLIRTPEPEYRDIGTPGTGRLKLANVSIWRPTAGRRVDIESVEKTITRMNERYQLASLAYDPWQASYLAERLGKAGIPAEQVPFSGPNLRSMCTSLLEAFREKNLDLYRHPDIEKDLRSLRVVEKSYGVRLDSPRGPGGHGDCATALAIGLHAASQITSGQSRVEGELVCYP